MGKPKEESTYYVDEKKSLDELCQQLSSVSLHVLSKLSDGFKHKELNSSNSPDKLFKNEIAYGPHCHVLQLYPCPVAPADLMIKARKSLCKTINKFMTFMVSIIPLVLDNDQLEKIQWEPEYKPIKAKSLTGYAAKFIDATASDSESNRVNSMCIGVDGFICDGKTELLSYHSRYVDTEIDKLFRCDTTAPEAKHLPQSCITAFSLYGVFDAMSKCVAHYEEHHEQGAYEPLFIGFNRWHGSLDYFLHQHVEKSKGISWKPALEYILFLLQNNQRNIKTSYTVLLLQTNEENMTKVLGWPFHDHRMMEKRLYTSESSYRTARALAMAEINSNYSINYSPLWTYGSTDKTCEGVLETLYFLRSFGSAYSISPDIKHVVDGCMNYIDFRSRIDVIDPLVVDIFCKDARVMVPIAPPMSKRKMSSTLDEVIETIRESKHRKFKHDNNL